MRSPGRTARASRRIRSRACGRPRKMTERPDGFTLLELVLAMSALA
ncbi:MAG: prepilin-type N-terminal cleavage/methylation domain-containing protein, partial [Deltaproteobacteria bacterium]